MGVKVWNPNKYPIRRTYPDGTTSKVGEPNHKAYTLQPQAVGEVPTKEIADQLVKDFGCTIGGKPATKDEEEQAAAENKAGGG